MDYDHLAINSIQRYVIIKDRSAWGFSDFGEVMISCEYNKSLYSLHTMHFHARSRYYIQVNTPQELVSVLSKLSQFQQIYWLGGGSNTIFLQDFDGLVLHLNNKGIQVVAEDNNQIIIEVQAGENWHKFIKICIKNQWFGLENLSLIPGTVGAAPVQNIGAYGVEVKDFIILVRGIDLSTGQPFEFNREQCLFSYRNSIFKQHQKWIITSVLFHLKKHFIANLAYQELADFIASDINTSTLSAQLISDYVIRLRQKKLPDPAVLGNSGSFFHNPVVDESDCLYLKKDFKHIPCYKIANNSYKVAAAWMIDQLGLKGFRIGDMAIHDQHALVIVNYGHGTAKQLLELISIVKDAVHNQFGLTLTIEPNLV